MNNKVIITIAISATILAQSALPAFAIQSIGGQKLVNQVTREENQSSKAAQRQGTELQNIITRSNTLISNRIASLNELSTRVQNDTRLSTNEKSTISSNIQTAISGLTALKTKIDADTDATTARGDEKTIITGYYVYAAFEPKTRYLVILNNLQTTTANLQALVPQLQNLINTLKSQGKDTTQLQSLLSDVSSQLQTINTTITSGITTVENIPTTSEPASGTFTSIKTNITQVVKTSFAKIQSDIQQMRPLFKQLISSNSTTPAPSQAATTTTPSGTQISPSPSASPSTTP